jgi:hypothetical protein
MSKLVISIIVITIIFIIALGGLLIWYFSGSTSTPTRPSPSAPTTSGPTVPSSSGQTSSTPTATALPPRKPIVVITPNITRCMSGASDADYYVESEGISLCPSIGPGLTGVTDIAPFKVFDKNGGRPADSVYLILMTNISVSGPTFTYITSPTESTLGQVIGFVYPPGSGKSNTQSIYLNTATVKGKIKTYLSPRSAAEAKQYDWTRTDKIADVPTSDDASLYA